MSPWRSFQIPMSGPVTSVQVEKIWILILGLGRAVPSRDLVLSFGAIGQEPRDLGSSPGPPFPGSVVLGW